MKDNDKDVKTELVMIDTVGMFRMRYVVEVEKGKTADALAIVKEDKALEFSQEYLGETIVSHRVVSKKEVKQVYAIDNGYADSWTDEQKWNASVTQYKQKPGNLP